MNPSLQRIAEHGDHLSIPAHQLPQQTSRQSGRWGGLSVRRVPAQVIKALLNRFPRSTIKYWQDVLLISARTLVNSKLVWQANDYDATANFRFTRALGLAMAWNCGTYFLDTGLNDFIEKVLVETLNSGGDVAAPHQLLTLITTQVECRKEVASKIRRALKDGRMSNIHLRELLHLFRGVITREMEPKNAEFLKIRNILTTLSSNPDMTSVVATQVAIQPQHCEDNILNVLEQVHVWAMTEKLFEEFNRNNKIRKLMIGLQSAYAESVFMEAMQSTYVLDSLQWLFNRGPLVRFSNSVVIYAQYKRFLSGAGVCKFLASPPRLEGLSNIYRFFTPNSRLFYQFQEVFLDKLSDVDAFFSFAQHLIVEKEGLLLRKDRNLRQRIDQERDQNVSELEQLAQLQAQGEITENQYIESSNRVMDEHKREMDEIWLGYISEQFSRLPETSKTILHSNPRVPPGRSTIQLVRDYGCDKLV